MQFTNCEGKHPDLGVKRNWEEIQLEFSPGVFKIAYLYCDRKNALYLYVYETHNREFLWEKNCDMNGLEQPYGRNILIVVEAHDGFYVLDHDLRFLLITP